MRLYLRLLYLRFLIPVLILVILLMTLDLPNWQIRLDASTLSAAHWKGTTVRDERDPADMMAGSKFPHEDRTARDVVEELIAISASMQTRWEAFQSYQAWARDDGKRQGLPEPTFRDERTGEARDQTKDRKKLFRPIILAEISAETLTVLNLLSVYLQKALLSAERASIGRNTLFWYKNHILAG